MKQTEGRLFHVTLDGETAQPLRSASVVDDFERGFLVGLLVGEGHFGGDGRQAQVTLRMHTRHESVFRWVLQAIPGSRLYGPYHHGGRSYYQWMCRGRSLRDHLLPILSERPELLDEHVSRRINRMCESYGLHRLSLGADAPPREEP